MYQFKYEKIELTDEGIIINRKNSKMLVKSARGEHFIPFSQIKSIMYSEPTMTKKGYLQFTTDRGGLQGALRTVNEREHAVYFSKKEQPQAEELKNIVRTKIK